MLTKPGNGVTALDPNASAATEKTAPPSHQTPSPSVSSPLPDLPLFTIQASGSWSAVNLRELWSYRELLYFLIWRDVKVRYKQTVLGAVWAILQPLFMMAIFSLMFSHLGGINTGNVPYPLFAFAGLVPWTFFANAVSMSGNSLVSSANLISKVYFPRLLVPVGAVAGCMVDFALSFALLAVALVFFGTKPTANLLMLPVLVALIFTLALGVGIWLSSVNVKYRDVRFVLPFLIQLWLFASSVILPSSSLPPRWRQALWLNPMSGVIEGFRAALFGSPFDWPSLGAAAAMAVLLLIYSTYSFRRMEKNFADII